MRKLLFSLLLPAWLLAGPFNAAAQSQPVAPAAPSDDQFVMHNHEIVLRKGSQDTPLTKNAVLANGTKINYKTGAVEYPDGRKTVLKEGDAVTMSGSVIIAKPATLPPTSQPATESATTGAPTPAPTSAPAAELVSAPASTPAPMPKTAAPAAVVARPTFAFRPAEPTNGKLRGVVELGASGFNSYIVRIDAQRSWKLEKADFSNNSVLENVATEEDIRKGLKAYIGQMLDYGVGGRDIHFLVSAGAVAAPITQKILKSLKVLGYLAVVVTPQQESDYALRATLPTVYVSKAFVADISSANTKVTWLQNGTPKALQTHGDKYFQSKIADAKAAADVQTAAKQVPPPLRSTCFIIGGVPYELAKAVRQGQERYTVLGAPETYPAQTNAKSKAGLTIYRALAAATKCQQFVFDWDASYTIGYLLTLPQ